MIVNRLAWIALFSLIVLVVAGASTRLESRSVG